MKPPRKTFIVGGALTPFIGKGHPDFIYKKHPDFGVRKNPTLEEYIRQVIVEALANTDIPAAAVDRGYVGNFLGELFAKQGLLGASAVAAHPDLDGKPFFRTEAACASGAVAVTSAVDAIAAGSDVVLAVGAEVECTVPGSEGAEYMARACHYETERNLDEFTFPYMFAVRAKAYKEAFGATDADLDRVILKAYENANQNPFAHMHDVRITPELLTSAQNRTFLADENLREHIRLYDCTHFSDGAAAIILVSEDARNRLGIPLSRCTEVLSYGMTTAALNGMKDPRRLTNVARAAKQAYAAAEVSPEDLQVVEVHDCFSISELQMMEAIQLAEEGQAPQLLKSGATARHGTTPVNAGGGLLGFGHPVGATGVKQIFEIHRQMKGLCGDYQLHRQPQLGLSANMGGDDRTAVVMIQRNLS